MARIVLLIAALLEFVLRGLPGFFGSEPVANLFGLEYIEEALVYVHPLGALMLTFGVMFFIAAKAPEKYKIVMDMGILRYALGTLSYAVTFVIMGSLATFWWVHLVIDIVMLVLFILARPKAAPSMAAAA